MWLKHYRGGRPGPKGLVKFEPERDIEREANGDPQAQAEQQRRTSSAPYINEARGPLFRAPFRRQPALTDCTWHALAHSSSQLTHLVHLGCHSFSAKWSLTIFCIGDAIEFGLAHNALRWILITRVVMQVQIVEA